jgi:excinuclease ABC subunit C
MKTNISTLPKLPGVYLFKGKDAAVLYIGKAANLAHRVASYFNAHNRDWNIKALLEEHTHIDHIVTHTAHEALVLEAHLIQQYQPKYNRLLKAGQPFVYILCTQGDIPDFKVVRTKQQKGIYFGPFVHKQDARQTLRFLSDTFKLNLCNKKIPHGCLQYHLGICAGSCRNDFDLNQYRSQITLALYVLRNEREAFCDAVRTDIKQCIDNFQFERAQHLHTYLEHVDTIFNAIAHRSSPSQSAAAVAHVQSKYTAQDYESIMHQLQQLIGAHHYIRTIDCFDISHFQSKNMVGSCIRFVEGKPDTRNFRRFAIRSLVMQNDYAALQEIVRRRYKNPDDIPDLILIDGGIGQLHAIQEIMPSTTVAALAKKEERLFSTVHPTGIVLDTHQNAARMLIALRDYAHHFAITYHRLRQKKNVDHYP